MSGPRIVSIVDDDRSVRQALESLVRSLDLQAEAFASAEEFLRSPRMSDTSCLILDLSMPGMHGLELHERLASDGSAIPVIVYTACGDEHARARAREAGAVAFVDKAVGGEAMLSALESALGQ